MSLTLAQKGLLLVAVPLLFELTFVAFLVVLLDRAENMVERQTRSREIVTVANDLSKNLFDGAYALVLWNYTKGEMFHKQFEQCQAAIPTGMDELKHLTKGSKRQSEHVQKLESISVTVLKELDEQAQNVETSKNIYGLKFGEYRSKLTEIFAPFITELKDLIKEEKRLAELAPAATLESRQQLRQCLAAGVCLNILLAIWLASFFSKQITGRLGVMTNNAERFAAGQALAPPVSGADEVAQLDVVFHKMAQALNEADQQKRDFVAMIGHDLRAPLNAIQGTLELLTRGSYGQLTERGQKRVSDAEEETDRLLCLINELLDIEKLEAGMIEFEFKPTNITQVINRAVNAVSGTAEAHEVKVEVASADVELSCDGDRIVQVLVNLLSNALKISKRGSTVSVLSSVTDGELELRVKDEGPGIAPEFVECIFDRFRQLPNQEGGAKTGTGLGLAICRALVLGHKGTIGVQSELGKGSTFWIRLPLS